MHALRFLRGALAGAAFAAGLASPALAAKDAPTPPRQDWSFSGIFGTFDRASAQRGLLVYKQVCASCHGLKRVAYRNLAAIGLSEDEIRALAAEIMVVDGPNDDGEMFERPGRPADRFRSPFPNEKAARAANNGAYPVDLSLITKARIGGADYLYALLTGYRDEPPPGVQPMEGMHWTEYFPGHWIAMARPLYDDMIEYPDGTKATTEQMAWDVTTFLAWASQPYLEQQRQIGVRAILFLLVLAGLTYAVKRRVWADLRH